MKFDQEDLGKRVILALNPQEYELTRTVGGKLSFIGEIQEVHQDHLLVRSVKFPYSQKIPYSHIQKCYFL